MNISKKTAKIHKVAEMILNTQYSNAFIAEKCHVSHHLVSKIRTVIGEKHYTLEDIQNMDDATVRIEFRRDDYSEPTGTRESSVPYCEPDYEYFAGEALKYKLTYVLMHEEYVEQCNAAGKVPYKITQFKEHLRKFLEKKEFSEVMTHHPGDEIEVDWVGDRAYWTNPETGEVVYGWMFVGVLSFSGKAYVEVFQDMKEANWIAAHVHMFEYFDGITKVLVCDNLKTGVLRHPRDSAAELQEDYESMSRYYGITIVPARVLAPNDKPLAENTVRFAEDHIIKKLRHAQCFSLKEYNDLVHVELEKLNNRNFSKKDGTRNSTFEKYEKQELLPLPSLPYRYSEKRKAVVLPMRRITIQSLIKR